MKAISLWQPWATLIAIGAKQYETRSWPANYTGELAIHAAKRKPRLYELNMDILAALKQAGFIRIDQLPLGGVVAVCNVAEVKTTAIFQPPRPERSFGDYGEGRYAWRLERVRPLKQILPFLGSQGWFDVPDEMLVDVW